MSTSRRLLTSAAIARLVEKASSSFCCVGTTSASSARTWSSTTAVAAAAAAAAATESTSAETEAVVRSKYRELLHIVKHISEPSKRDKSLQELRTKFREPLPDDDHQAQHQQRQQDELEESAGAKEQVREGSVVMASALVERLKDAEQRASFAKMNMVTRYRPRRNTGDDDDDDGSTGNSGRWIYKDGRKFSNVSGTLRDDKGRVVTNWDGKNLDPDSVKQHKQQLRRAGFVNNLHAKGIF